MLTGPSPSPAGSGNGSSRTGGNGNAGPSTGSVDNTNSLEKGAKIEQVEAGLKDVLDKWFIPNTYHTGTDRAGQMTFMALNVGNDGVQNLAQSLIDINKDDPVTNVFGTYHRVGNPITDYTTVLERLQNGGGALKTGLNGSKIEVTTASGKVYNLFTFNGKVIKSENKP